METVETQDGLKLTVLKTPEHKIYGKCKVNKKIKGMAKFDLRLLRYALSYGTKHLDLKEDGPVFIKLEEKKRGGDPPRLYIRGKEHKEIIVLAGIDKNMGE